MNLEFKKLVKKALKEALTEQKINGKKCCKCKDKILINQKRYPIKILLFLIIYRY